MNFMASMKSLNYNKGKMGVKGNTKAMFEND